MLWLNLEMSTLENEAFGCAENASLGTWLRLMRYCCVQENRGWIRGAKQWDARKCLHLLRLERADLDQTSELWTWKGPDLLVHFFPTERLAQVKRLRGQSRGAANSRWEKVRAKRHQDSVPTGMPSGTVAGIPVGNAERKGKEGKRKGRGKEGKGTVPAGTDGRAHTLAEVVSFFAASGAPADLAAEFYRHFSANGWRQRSGLALADWRPEAEKWITRWEREQVQTAGKKTSDDLGPPPGFDPKQPHAHTGGVEVI